jgi:hypothetical protein
MGTIYKLPVRILPKNLFHFLPESSWNEGHPATPKVGAVDLLSYDNVLTLGESIPILLEVTDVGVL